MSRQIINIGAVANDGTGDTLRGAATKMNQNLAELYKFFGGDSVVNTSLLRFAGDSIGPSATAGTNVNVVLRAKGNGQVVMDTRVALKTDPTPKTATGAAGSTFPVTMCNSATAFSLTLDSGKVDGQIKKFVNLNTNAAGIVTITPIAFGQGSTIALKAKGTIELNWYSGKWYSMQDSSTFFTIN